METYISFYLKANRIHVFVDALREIEREGGIGELNNYFYSTVGNTTAVSSAKKFATEIAGDMIRNGIRAAILTSN